MDLNVDVYSDSILKYLPAWDTVKDSNINYRRWIYPGITVEKMAGRIQTPETQDVDAVVLHVGTNSLCNYFEVSHIIQYFHIDLLYTRFLVPI